MSLKKRKPLKWLAIVILILTAAALFLPSREEKKQPTRKSTPTPTMAINTPFTKYTPPQIPHKSYYKIALVGDSMTFALGVHGGKLSEYLNQLYKSTPGNQRIVIDNHAVGSTNILDLKDQLTKPATAEGETLKPVLEVKPDLILIESFGYNPLSQLGLNNGQKKQTETLDQTMQFLTAQIPNTAIMFVATIAPNKETYAQNENPGSKPSDREAQAQERIDYIKNHIDYARSHNIPVINIYEKSLTTNGDGNTLYINPGDNIHPSAAGIDFISHEIANYVYESHLLPQ